MQHQLNRFSGDCSCVFLFLVHLEEGLIMRWGTSMYYTASQTPRSSSCQMTVQSFCSPRRIPMRSILRNRSKVLTVVWFPLADRPLAPQQPGFGGIWVKTSHLIILFSCMVVCQHLISYAPLSSPDNTSMSYGGLVSTSNIVDDDKVTVTSDSDLIWTISLRHWAEFAII